MRKVVLAGAIAAILALVALVFWSRPAPIEWLRDARQENADAVAERHRLESEKAAAQDAVRALSGQVGTLTKRATVATAASATAEARARMAAATADELRARIAQLEAERRARPVIRSLPEAREALRELGYAVR